MYIDTPTANVNVTGQYVVLDGHEKLTSPIGANTTNKSSKLNINTSNNDDIDTINNLKQRLLQAEETIEEYKHKEKTIMDVNDNDKFEIIRLTNRIDSLNEELHLSRELYLYNNKMNNTTNTTVPSSSSLPSSARNDSNIIKMKLNNAISAIMTYQNSTSSSSSTNNTTVSTSTTTSNKGDNSLLLPITASLFALQQSLFELLQYEETLATKAAVIHDLQAQLIEKKEEINTLKATPTLPPIPPALPSPSSSQDSTPPQTLRKQPSTFFTPAPNPQPPSTITSATPAVPTKQSQNTFITTTAPTANGGGDGNRRPQPPVSVMIDEENGKLRIMISKARKKVMLGEYTV